MTTEITTSVETITPEGADKLLSSNVTNRSISSIKVEQLIRDMTSGDFQLNGETIQIGRDGTLLNGQHRLTACVRSGVPFRTVVVRNLPPEVRRTIDSGRSRSFSDRLQMEGVENATTVAAALRMIHAIAHRTAGTTYPLTESELDTLFTYHSDIEVSAKTAKHLRFGFGATGAAIHYIGTQLGARSLADDFVSALHNGVPLYSGCPVHATRERVLSAAGTRRPFKNTHVRLALVNAWNHLSDKRSVRSVRLPEVMKISGWTEQKVGL